MARALAVRIGYVGELGYELYIPQEFAAHVYETLWSAGEAHGIANAGYRAIDSCRMEKGYLYWSGDITPDYNPYEAGLGFCVALDKGDFIGRDALAKIKAEGVTRKLCSFTVEGFAPLLAARRSCMTARWWARPAARALATRSARPLPSAIFLPRSQARRAS